MTYVQMKKYKGRARNGKTHYKYTKKIKRPECKECFKEIMKQWYADNPKKPTDYWKKHLNEITKELEKYNV